MTVSQRPKLIIYGDFNCPFCALASTRVSYLERLGLAEVDWRAVEHAPNIPPDGQEIIGDLRDEIQREIDQIRSLLSEGETDPLTLPSRQPNTNRATAAYASASVVVRPKLRERLFNAYWMHDADLADSETLMRLGATHQNETAAAQWRNEWLALPNPLVPIMVLPDGYISRGLGALARLVQLANDRGQIDLTDLGGESPCFAHLLEEPID